jgi:hypothetical protein
MTPRADDVPRRQLGMNGVGRAERTSGDMAAQRAAGRFVMVMPAGNAAHIEPCLAFGLGKPCYAVGPVARTETLYRFFDRMFTSSDDPESGLPRRSVKAAPRGARSRGLPT